VSEIPGEDANRNPFGADPGHGYSNAHAAKQRREPAIDEEKHKILAGAYEHKEREYGGGCVPREASKKSNGVEEPVKAEDSLNHSC